VIKVNIIKNSQAPVSSVFVRSVLKKFLAKNGIVSDALVNVAIVTKPKMLKLAFDYLDEKDKPAHNVLAFTANETRQNFVYPPEFIFLGEIVVCYPVGIEEAKKEGSTLDTKFEELITHGALHLLGIHHK